MQDRDMFEKLKRIVRRDYSSALQYCPWLDRAGKEIARMNLRTYSLFAFSDAAKHLYADKQTFGSCEAVREGFRKRLRRVC